jgi:signal transduction histidine kinase
LEERLGDDPRTRAQMDQALGDVGRLEATVAGALQLARSGRVNLQPIDVREPVEAAMQHARPEFEARGAVLDPVECSTDSTVVRGDAVALERMVLNLLLNAAHALQAGQAAGVVIEADQDSIVVRVRDCGAGIAPDALARVFEPFYSGKRDGTGLGLAIVKQIVAAHGGDVTIESHIGAGTSVRVILTPAT